MSDLLEFDSELHCDLFKLMILASNEYSLVVRLPELAARDVDRIVLLYPFQFNDRSIAPIEYEGWVNRSGLACIEKKLIDFYCHRENPCMGGDKKLIFRFEE